MRLFIIRHGKAERHSPSGTDDDRHLTKRGERQASHLGEALAALVRAPAVLLCSPILRAQQTAEIIAPALQLPIQIDDRLTTGSTPEEVIEAINEAASEHAPDSVLIVGHNPHFEQLTWDLGPRQPSYFELRTGECVILEGDLPLKPHDMKALDRIRLDDES